MAYYNSPQMTEYSFEGVHLLPDYQYPYNQRTYTPDGIEMEDVQNVFVCNLCGNELSDIADYFTVLEVFNDPATGLPQIIWQLKEVNFDAGFQPIYLKIRTGENVFVYSTVFYLTAKNQKYTSYWGYKNKMSDETLYIGLVAYFRQPKSQHEISNYSAVNTGETFTAASRITAFERWSTGVIEVNIFEEIKRLFLCRYLYSVPQTLGGLPVRTNLHEIFETPDLEADENFIQQEMMLLRNYSKAIDPNAIPVVPPDPPVDVPFINLIQVISQNDKYVKYYFEYGLFTPSYFTYQFSLDQINWTDSTGDFTSPHQVTVPNNPTFGYYYRIYYPPLNLYSNIVKLPEPSIVINNITSPQSQFIQIGNNYFIAYTTTGFTPGNLTFEASIDGTSWNTGGNSLYYNNTGSENPRPVQTATSGVEFKYFRIRFSPLGLTSNVFNFEF